MRLKNSQEGFVKNHLWAKVLLEANCSLTAKSPHLAFMQIKVGFIPTPLGGQECRKRKEIPVGVGEDEWNIEIRRLGIMLQFIWEV